MKPFTHDDPGPCPKCYSYEGWNLRYNPPKDHYSNGEPGYYDFLEFESLSVVCRNCGFYFLMETADSKVPA